jgi:hypothetical protein
MDGPVLMPRYEVTAWVGTVRVEVEADNEDEAIVEADALLPAAMLESATYETRELSD